MTDAGRPPRRDPRVAIIGGGWGGIAAAVALTRRGIRSFTIFERNSGPGGVWLVNTFPGLTVDVPSPLYSFSFHPFAWSRTHARREEILRYTDEVVERFALRDRFRFDTNVAEVAWDEAQHAYRLRTSRGERLEFDVVISAVGLFNTPRYPDWPGLDEFEGVRFHTARWEHDHDLSGKRVAVVGTGSTAAQVVPSIAPIAGRVIVFQREPGWAVPREDRDLSPEELHAMRRRSSQARARLRAYLRVERLILFGMTRTRRRKSKLQRIAEAYIDSILADRPELTRSVTPTYPILGKRPIFDGGYYAALRRDNVDLVPKAVTRVTRTGVVDSDGVERDVDVLIMATGFTASEFLSTVEIVGRDGLRLRDFWGPEPTAFLGITVPRFPNLFIVYGPNTNGGGSLAVQIERQAEHIARVVERMARRNLATVEVADRAYRAWDRYVTWRNGRQVYAGTHNYFRASTGKVVTQWPGTMTEYWLMTRLPARLALREVEAPAVRMTPDPLPRGEIPRRLRAQVTSRGATSRAAGRVEAGNALVQSMAPAHDAFGHADEG